MEAKPFEVFRKRIPTWYKHGKQLNKFKKLRYHHPEGIITSDNRMSDKNCSRTTGRLKSGILYEFQFYRIKKGKKISFRDCFLLLSNMQSLLIGPQGLTLLYQIAHKYFPKDLFALVMDVESSLFKSEEGLPQVFIATVDQLGNWTFKFHPYLRDPDGYFYIVVCKEVTEDE
jgi:hypothetical protein